MHWILHTSTQHLHHISKHCLLENVCVNLNIHLYQLLVQKAPFKTQPAKPTTEHNKGNITELVASRKRTPQYRPESMAVSSYSSAI